MLSRHMSLHKLLVMLEIKTMKMTQILSLMVSTMGLEMRFLRKRKTMVSIKEM